jgi:hypothetical protein
MSWGASCLMGALNLPYHEHDKPQGPLEKFAYFFKLGIAIAIPITGASYHDRDTFYRG